MCASQGLEDETRRNKGGDTRIRDNTSEIFIFFQSVFTVVLQDLKGTAEVMSPGKGPRAKSK